MGLTLIVEVPKGDMPLEKILAIWCALAYLRGCDELYHRTMGNQHADDLVELALRRNNSAGEP